MRKAKQGSRLRLVVAIVGSLVVAGSQAATSLEVTGLWGWHEAWKSAPAEVVKETGPNWHARGMLINFCPGGRLRMAMGVFYRGTGSANLGSSDGLSLYEGWWSAVDGAITTTYRLVDSEIPFADTNRAPTQMVEHPRIADGVLLFAFRGADDPPAPTQRFNRANLAGDVLSDRFVECDARSSK